MKKIVITTMVAGLSFAFAFAQLTGVSGTIGGTPVQVNVNQGGITGVAIGGGSAVNQTQGQINGSALLQLLGLAQIIVIRLVPFLIGLAVVAFFWFLVTYIWGNNDKPEDKAKNARSMGWSILAIFVMVSVWGIITFIATLTGIGHGGGGDSFAPRLPGQTQ
jgi:hypothetical protein